MMRYKITVQYDGSYFPGLAMFFLVLGLSFIGEDLEEIFDSQNSE